MLVIACTPSSSNWLYATTVYSSLWLHVTPWSCWLCSNYTNQSIGRVTCTSQRSLQHAQKMVLTEICPFSLHKTCRRASHVHVTKEGWRALKVLLAEIMRVYTCVSSSSFAKTSFFICAVRTGLSQSSILWILELPSMAEPHDDQ